jgi:hypothetical protein
LRNGNFQRQQHLLLGRHKVADPHSKKAQGTVNEFVTGEQMAGKPVDQDGVGG